MINKEIREKLSSLKDEKYQKFCASLMPTVSEEKVMGVRTPLLKKLAKEYADNRLIGDFLNNLPHRYFEENNLHAFIIGEEKDFENAVKKAEDFLPFIDNWATCDQLIVKAFKKAPAKLLPYIDKWISSNETYAVRFAIGLLMRYFLNELFDERYLTIVVQIQSNEYYVNMMRA